MLPRLPAFASLLIAVGCALLSLGAAAADSSPPVNVPKANCGPGSSPEDGLQGQVPLSDRIDGRSQMGYRCNLELVGQYPGQGASWQLAWYGDCAYYDEARTLPGGTAGNAVPSSVFRQLPPRPEEDPGTVVVDAADPAHPNAIEHLTSHAMIDPWESLKVNQARGLLAAVEDGGPGFSVYDVKSDCAHPKLLADVDLPLANTKGHAGNFAPDGLTYYGTDLPNGHMYPIDLTDPAHPKELTVWSVPGTVNAQGQGGSIHDMSTSADGDLAYLAYPPGGGGTPSTDGLLVVDTSKVQHRVSTDMGLVGSLFWSDGSEAQMTLPFTAQRRQLLVFVDEAGRGAARILDVTDPTHVKLVSRLWLEVDDPANNAMVTPDESDAPPGAGGFGYQGHYCNLDRETDPTILVCSYFQSGLRVFDIRDPYHPREIAYYNPPAKPGYNPASNYNRSGLSGFADWVSALPRVVGDKGEIWFTSQENGFQIVRFTNGAWPFTSPTAPASAVRGVTAGTSLPNTSRAADPRFLGLAAAAAIGLLLLAGVIFLRRRRPA